MSQQLDHEAREALAAVISRIIREAIPTPAQCASYEGDEEAHRAAHPIHLEVDKVHDPDLDDGYGYAKLREIEFFILDDVDAAGRMIADGFLGVNLLEGFEVAA